LKYVVKYISQIKRQIKLIFNIHTGKSFGFGGVTDEHHIYSKSSPLALLYS